MRVLPLLLLLTLMIGSTVAAQEPPPAQVVTAQISQAEIAENQSFVGLLYYDRTSLISSEVAGLVKSIKVKEGDHIKKGTLLVSLDTEILDHEISLNKVRVAQIDLTINHTEKNHLRLKKLYDQSGVSEKDYDDAFYAYQNAIQEKEILAEELNKLLIKKRKSEIFAPFEGVILQKNIDSGAWVQQGTLLVELASSKDLFVKVPISETLLQFVSTGQQVPLVINAFAKELTGIVADFSPIADPATKNIFLKIRIPSLNRVAANMSATVYVPTSNKKSLNLIPRDALIKFQGKDFVYTIKDGKASILPVNIVTYLNDQVGVDNPYFVPGMPVVVVGNERLRPDQPVTVVEER